MCSVSNLYKDLHFIQVNYFQHFPCGSAGKESAFTAGNLGSFPGLGRYPGEGRGYPLQYSGLENSWPIKHMGLQRIQHECATFISFNLSAFLVAQTVKRLPAMWETWVRSLGQEDPLEKEMATHSSTLAWKIPWMGEPGRLQSMGSQRVGHDWATSLHFNYFQKTLDIHNLKRIIQFKQVPFENVEVWFTSVSSVQSLSGRNWTNLLQPHGLQHARLPCPSPTPRVYSKLMSIKSGMPSNYLTLCHPLLLPPSIFPSISVFSDESVLPIRWPKYWSFSFSISPSNEYSGLISFRMDWLDLLVVQDTL